MKLFAQQGYGKGDKIHIGFEKNFLDGVLLSPRDERDSTMKTFINQIREDYSEKTVLFDPQYYYSLFEFDTAKRLDETNYHNIISNLSGFRSFKNVTKMIELCLEYQISLGVEAFVSPSIHFHSFSDRQAQIALQLAEESINQANEKSKDVFVSLVFNKEALNNKQHLNDFLNELTTLDCEGFYITLARKHTNYNQLFETEDTLSNLLTLIYSLGEINQYKVVMGYSDIIGLLYSAVGAYGIGTGWYNSSRKFTLQQRVYPVTGGRHPNERYTSIPLLNSILMSELDSIAAQITLNGGSISKYQSNSNYEHLITQGPSPSSSWSRNTSYLQHWSAIKNSFNDIFEDTHDITAKLDRLVSQINIAKENYSRLERLGIQFDLSSNSSHLTTWESAIKKFRELHSI